MTGPLRVFFSRLFRRARFERDIDAELAFHVERRTEDLSRRGIPPDEARRRARVEFGGVEQCKERLRARRPGAALDALVQDLRLSARRLRREPAFAASVAITLSLGIGASTAVFGLVSATLVSRIPYGAPDRLLIGRTTRNGEGSGFVSGLDYFDYRTSTRSFESLAAFYAFPDQATVTGRDAPWVARTGYVSWNLFRTLTIDPVIGRHFLPAEEAQPDPRVAIIGFDLWQRRFGGSHGVVGETIVLDGVPHAVIGVLPLGFRFLWDADVWRVAVRPDESRDRHNYHLLGRLRTGASMADAQRDVDGISRALERAYPDTNAGKGLRLVTLQEYLGRDVRAGLLLPAAATACLLLITCANVAGLLLARGQRRMTDAAMRATLGASRGRLVRQFVTESVVLTLPAGLLGIGVADLLQRILLRLLPVDMLGLDRPVVDLPVMLFAFAASVATGLLVGVLPAIRSTSTRLWPHLAGGRQGLEPARGAYLRSGLIAAQIAISVVLLIGSGLLARSLVRLTEVDFGFSAERVLTARIAISAPAYPDRGRRQAFFESLLQQIRALPGVRSAAVVNNLPVLDPGNIWRTRAADRPVAPGERGQRTLLRRVSADYFATMRMPIVSGRAVSDRDRDDRPMVAVLSESLARRLFGDRDPIGRQAVIITGDGPGTACEVVGIVRDARLSDPRVDADPAMYLSVLQASPLGLRLVVRTVGEPLRVAGMLQAAVRRLDRNALVADLQTMEAVVDSAFSDLRRVTSYLGLFAGLALLLASVGLYGAVAYHVSQQEHEFGIRLALGATPTRIVGTVTRRSFVLVAAGLIAGVAAAFPGTKLLESLLYEVVPLDPITHVGAVLLLCAVTGCACLLPALRIARLDASATLRRM